MELVENLWMFDSFDWSKISHSQSGKGGDFVTIFWVTIGSPRKKDN